MTVNELIAKCRQLGARFFYQASKGLTITGIDQLPDDLVTEIHERGDEIKRALGAGLPVKATRDQPMDARVMAPGRGNDLHFKGRSTFNLEVEK